MDIPESHANSIFVQIARNALQVNAKWSMLKALHPPNVTVIPDIRERNAKLTHVAFRTRVEIMDDVESLVPRLNAIVHKVPTVFFVPQIHARQILVKMEVLVKRLLRTRLSPWITIANALSIILVKTANSLFAPTIGVMKPNA